MLVKPASGLLLSPPSFPGIKEPGLGDELVGSRTHWDVPQHLGPLVSGVISL